MVISWTWIVIDYMYFDLLWGWKSTLCGTSVLLILYLENGIKCKTKAKVFRSILFFIRCTYLIQFLILSTTSWCLWKHVSLAISSDQIIFQKLKINNTCKNQTKVIKYQVIYRLIYIIMYVIMYPLTPDRNGTYPNWSL